MALKVLVTGSCGFIFSNFTIYALQETNWDLVSIDKLTYAGSIYNITQCKRHKLYIGDVCDYHFVKKIFELEKPDIVIHGAAESHVDNSINNASPFIQTNVTGTYNMLEAAMNIHMPSKFINISTDEVYGSVDFGSSKENDPLMPRSPYASTKASADLLAQSYYTTHSLPVVTTRCSNNYGPRQHVEKFIPKIITNVLTGKEIPLYGDGLNKREWIYCKDNFYALQMLVEKGLPGNVYNIGSGQEKTNVEVLETIFNIMGTGRELVKHVEDRKGHDRRYSVDCSKMKSLGWSPKYTFEDALAHTIGWYKANAHWFWKNEKSQHK